MENAMPIVSGEASESDIEVETVSRKVANMYGTVVPGEAPESDDDMESTENIIKANKSTTEVEKSVEETNDDDDDEDSCSSASEAFMCRSLALTVPVNDDDTAVTSATITPKYNTLLHKKLRESNAALERNFSELLNRPLIDASQKLNDINQHLLTSQVAVQNASSSVQKALNTLLKIDNNLSSVLSMPYLPKINIHIPPKNNTS